MTSGVRPITNTNVRAGLSRLFFSILQNCSPYCIARLWQMPDLCRREFLKLFGIVGTGAVLSGCGEPAARYLIPYINPPEDVVPGKAVYYATTCRECPAGCGMLAKNREGRIVKVEGNPAHPVSGGKLCMRGQASLHGLYNPDRYPGPMLRNQAGGLDPLPGSGARRSWPRS